MKRLIICLIGFFIYSAGNLFPQSFFKVEIGGGYISNSGGSRELQYWDNGWTISVKNSFEISNNFDLVASFSYYNLDFSSIGILYATPANPRVIGYNSTINGNNSHVYEATVGVRAILIPKSFIQPFLSIRTGALFINEGNINMTSWMDQTPNRKNTNVFYNGKDYLVGITSFGLGTMFDLIGNLKLVAEGNISITYSNQSNLLTSIMTSLQYNF